jgi:hypothetical protein
MDHWSVLELDSDADERSIKRQYAKLLKKNRPDDNPDSFQRLREAYEYALNRARMRFDEDEAENEAVLEAPRNPPAAHMLFSVDPLQVKPGPASSELAAALALQTTSDNLQQQHQQALEQHCTEPFQQALVARCLKAPEDEIALLKAGIAHLHWLTPWQTARINRAQQEQLTQALLDSELNDFQEKLARGEERQLLNSLQTLSRQPWLSALESRQQLYRWVLMFLHNTHGWSLPLFDRICALFGWETTRGAQPQPEFIWCALIERCEKQAYLQRLQNLLVRNSTVTEEQAAILVLRPPASNAERVNAARNSNADVWEACKLLCNQLTYRYPDLLEHFPDADLEGWRELHTRPLHSIRWIWIGWLLMAVFYALPQQIMTRPTSFADVAALLGVYPMIMTALCTLFMRAWRPIASALAVLDEWISQQLLPDTLSWRGSQALLIRHGVPLVLCGVITSKADAWALACYSTLMFLWIFASPGRYPKFFARLQEKAMGLVRLAKRGPVIFIATVLVVSAFKFFTQPAWQIPPAHTAPLVASAPFNCLSAQSLDPIKKACENAADDQRCRNAKIAECVGSHAKGHVPESE